MTGFTAGEVLAILGGFVTIITALSVGVVNVIVALRTTAKVDQTLIETKQVAAKVEQVHVLTNANLTAVKAELALASSQILALRELVQDLRAERERRAIEVATNTPVAPAVSVEKEK